MRAYCCTCGQEIELPIDQFLEVDQDIDDFFCDDCAEKAIEFIIDLQLRLN